jgi:hypothetical protein
MRRLVLDSVIGVLGRRVKLYVPIHAFAFLSLLQLFYLQFHAVLRSKTIRISYNEIVRYLPDLERRVSHVSHYSDPNRICLFAKPSLQNLDVILDEVSCLPWRPVLPGTATALASLLQRFTN